MKKAPIRDRHWLAIATVASALMVAAAPGPGPGPLQPPEPTPDVRAHLPIVARRWVQVGREVPPGPDWSRPVGVLSAFTGPFVIDGRHLVAAFSERLIVFDVSNPEAPPHEVGRLPTELEAEALAVAGTTAFLGEKDRLRTIDLTDRAAPRELAAVDIGGRIADIQERDGIAYLASSQGLVLVVAADPAHPRVLATLGLESEAVAVRIAGDTAYVLTSNDGRDSHLIVVDVADPSAPRAVGQLALADRSSGLAVAGGLAIVAGAGGLQVLDVTGPAAPRQIGALASDTITAWDVWLAGPVAWLAGDGGLTAVDISEPTRPRVAGVLGSVGEVYRVRGRGGTAWAAGPNTLQAVDVADPDRPRAQASLELLGFASDVEVVGGYAFVASWRGGLGLVDVTSPRAPHLAAWLALPIGKDAQAVVVRDGVAYLVAGSNLGGWLCAVDVSDPRAPRLLGTVDTPTVAPTGIDVAGGRAFVTTFPGGLHVFDVRDPVAMRHLGWVSLPGSQSVIADGDVAYVVASGNDPAGLFRVDVTDPSAPRVIDSIGSSGMGLHLGGDLVFVAGLNAARARGLVIYDRSRPGPLAEVGFLDLPWWPVAVDVVGGTAYVLVHGRVDEAAHLVTVDVTDPSAPRELHRQVVADTSQHVDVADGLAYVADGLAGLVIHRVLRVD